MRVKREKIKKERREKGKIDGEWQWERERDIKGGRGALSRSEK